jgi:hypothetical protein
MALRNERELANSERKLAILERLLANAKESPGPGAAVEIRSLSALVNELRTETVGYKADLLRQHRKS